MPQVAIPRILLAPVLLAPVLLALVLLAAPAAAQGGPDLAPADRQAIQGVIADQLDAFQRDAAGEAFTYASPMIQNKFGSPARFMDMVRNGYPQVYRPQGWEFQGMRTIRGLPAQEVLFIGPSGQATLGLYIMERQPSGRWRIDGVRIERLPDRVS
jgi:hypothetical protein